MKLNQIVARIFPKWPGFSKNGPIWNQLSDFYWFDIHWSDFWWDDIYWATFGVQDFWWSGFLLILTFADLDIW